MSGEAQQTTSTRIPMLVERFKPGDRVVSVPAGMRGKVLSARMIMSGGRYKVRWENGYVGSSVSPGSLERDQTPWLTLSQFSALKLAATGVLLCANNSEQALALRLTEAAHTATLESLQKRKLIDTSGAITADGESTLRHPINRTLE